jgi:hypothetical protein
MDFAKHIYELKEDQMEQGNFARVGDALLLIHFHPLQPSPKGTHLHVRPDAVEAEEHH